MHPKNISIKDFIYELPEEKIAFHPLENRDDAKLLVYKDGALSSSFYREIHHHIPSGSLMVFNNTKVVEARLLFKKDTGGLIEIFCLQPHEMYADITSAMNQPCSVKWLCLVGGAAKWKNGQPVYLRFFVGEEEYLLKAEKIDKRSDCFVIELSWNGALSFAEVLHHAGHVPLPPYIKRNDEDADKTRYQTVYAKHDGSVAAPTAGLHFTKKVLDSLEANQVKTDFVTLHVGAGTFKPVKAETMDGHEMHNEFIEVRRELILQLLSHNSGPVIAVGTTTLRTLESLYWIGAKLVANYNVFDDGLGLVALSQWEPYEMEIQPAKELALKALLDYFDAKKITRLIAKTQIIIAPGYSFKIIDGLVTNFHQPASTLLLLVAALVGNEWRKVYHYALQNNFRFLSYGDGSLLWKTN